MYIVFTCTLPPNMLFSYENMVKYYEGIVTGMEVKYSGGLFGRHLAQLTSIIPEVNAVEFSKDNADNHKK